MLIVITPSVSGQRIVQAPRLARRDISARHVGSDIAAFLRSIAGAELPECTRMMAGARGQALECMAEHARSLGADAVVEVRLATATAAPGESEIVAHGTAVPLTSDAGA